MEYLMNEHGVIINGGMNLKGEVVKKTKMTHPYSYEEFVLWKSGSKEEIKHTVYDDRMRQWDNEKYKEASVKVWGKNVHLFDNVCPKDVERFLRLYTGEEIQLKAITESCNMASGYPIFAFHY